MKDLIMKIILIGFVIFIGYTFVNGDTNSLKSAATTVLTNANSVISQTDITDVEHKTPTNS